MPSGPWIAWLGWTLLALGGGMLLYWAIGRSGRNSPRCPRCDYDMTGAPSLECPECGRTAKSDRALRRRRRKGVYLRLGVLVALAGGVLAAMNPVRKDGWAAPVPLFVLREIAPFFDDDGKQLVSPLNPSWVMGTMMSSMTTTYGANNTATAQAIAAAMPTFSMPTRWERVLLARQGELAARRLMDPSVNQLSGATDAHLLGQITSLLHDDEYLLLRPAAERLVESPHQYQQTYGMTYLRRTAAGTGRRLDRIGELGRIGATPELRKYAYETIVVVAERESDAAATALIPGLSDPDGQTRLAVAGRLQKLGKWGTPALAELDRVAASDPDVWIQAGAKMAAEVIRRESGKK